MEHYKKHKFSTQMCTFKRIRWYFV